MNSRQKAMQDFQDRLSQIIKEAYKLQLSENIKAGIRHAKLLKANSKK